MSAPSKNTLNEAQWWDRFGQINDNVWRFSDLLFDVVRKDYLQELRAFVYKPDGSLLDFGCGSGRISIPLARMGMQVQGIDISREQIDRARNEVLQLQLPHAIYSCGSLDMLNNKEPFDSAIVHAVIHHLPDREKRLVLEKISGLLVDGGRLFLYEPMAANPDRPETHVLFDKAMIAIFRMMRLTALFMRWYLPELETLERSGWQMRSPDEAPIQFRNLLAMVPRELVLKKYTYWHAYSMKYAHFCMSLKTKWRKRLEKGVTIFYWFDHRILASGLKDSIKVWPMASFLFEKSPPNLRS